MKSPRLRKISRYRWPLLITLVVSATAAFSLTPLVSVAAVDASIPAQLRATALYDLVAPASNILDALTLLTPGQYWSTFGFCVFVFFAAKVMGLRKSGRPLTVGWSIRAIAQLAGGTVAVIGIMLLAPRPMAALALSDPDLIAVDFHSHTSASHDGRPGFDEQKNRDWHSGAGFNAAYVTDHRTVAAAIVADEHNPPRAGDGTVLLPGVELHGAGEHPILIGIDPRRMKISSPDWQEAAVEADGGPVPPLLLLSMPGNLTNIPRDETDGRIRIAGIEAADGSPRGTAQTARDRKQIFALAERAHLAMVSGSDNHGWGHTAPAWTVLRIPGWRAMTPAALDIAIRQTLLAHERGGVTVIARRTVPPASGKLEATFAGVAVGLLIFRTMKFGDRVSWAAWSWFGGLLGLLRKRRNRRHLRLLVRRNSAKPVLRPAYGAAAMEAAS